MRYVRNRVCDGLAEEGDGTLVLWYRLAHSCQILMDRIEQISRMYPIMMFQTSSLYHGRIEEEDR